MQVRQSWLKNAAVIDCTVSAERVAAILVFLSCTPAEKLLLCNSHTHTHTHTNTRVPRPLGMFIFDIAVFQAAYEEMHGLADAGIWRYGDQVRKLHACVKFVAALCFP